MTDTAPDDLVAVTELDAIDGAYLKAQERAAGRVSRRVLDARRRGAEGAALAKMRSNGETLAVRHVENREGVWLMTNGVQQRIDLNTEANR